jgi:hypothetical protein
MPRSDLSRLFIFVAAALAFLLISPLDRAHAQTEEPDTVKSDDSSSGKVRISIDESGISIEGRANVATEESDEEGDEWIEVYDGRRKYREKGLDIFKVGKSVFVARDELVRGDLVVFGGSAVVEGRVSGNVIVIGGDIRARSGSVIKGDAVVIGGVLDEDEDVIIKGERATINKFIPVNIIWPPLGESTLFKAVVFPVKLFIQLILAFLVLLFLRERISRCDGHLADNFLKNFGVGILAAFVGVFALIIVSLLLLITLIGIPLAVLLWISCAGVLIFAWTIFAYTAGRLVANRMQIQSDNAFLHVFIGAVVINLPSIIAWGLNLTFISVFSPLAVTVGVIGWFVKGFAYLSGFGALILSRFGARELVDGANTTPAAPPTPPAPGLAGTE